MHTEDEAKQKWCPFARVVEYDPEGSEPIEGYPVGNRSAPFRGQTHAHPYARCIASQCMAWRWGAPRINRGKELCADCDGKGEQRMSNHSVYVCHRCEGTGRKAHYESQGYCGLARKDPNQ